MTLGPHRQILIPILTALIATTATSAVWTTDGFDALLPQLERAELENVSILPFGSVGLAPRLARVCSLEEGAVWRAARASGALYLATGSNSRVFRVEPGKPVQRVFDGGPGEVLAITADGRGSVFFGTTPEGNIYRIIGREAAFVCSTGCTYIFTLLPAADGSILCGTGENGRLLCISPAGTPELLFTAPQSHISALAWAVPGRELLVGTTPGGLTYRLRFAQGWLRTEVTVLYDTPLEEVRAIVTAGGRVYVGANPADGNDSAAVFCIDSTGICLWQWRCPDSVIFDLAPQGDRILVATGNRGLLYSLDRHGRASLVRNLAEPQALCLATHGRELLVGTGNPARLLRLGPGNADSGRVASLPFDCTNPARFGRFDFRASVPAGTELKFAFRSGNCSEPDSTWHPWSAAAGRVPAPSARFVQWRAHLSSRFPNLSPELRRVDAWFEPANLAPVIASVSVAGPTEAEARQGLSKPKRDVTWSATDPEADSLAFDVYLRAETEAGWLHIGRDLTEPRFELDTRALPDGWYEVKVVASDRPERTATAALTGERVSSPFLADNTPPRVLGLSVRNGQAVFTVADALSAISACRVSVNAGDWRPALPLDGLTDSPEERFSVTVELEPGPNVVAVWAVDAQGNVGAGRTSLP